MTLSKGFLLGGVQGPAFTLGEGICSQEAIQEGYNQPEGSQGTRNQDHETSRLFEEKTENIVLIMIFMR